MIPSGLWKSAARMSLKNRWLTALLIALIVSLPSLLVQGIGAVTGNDLIGKLLANDQIREAYEAAYTGGTVDAQKLTAGVTEVLRSPGLWVIQGLRIVAWLVTPCLTLGMTAWLLSCLRRQEPGDVSAVFSRMNLFFKGIGLRLYVAWRIFLFMLPGVGVYLLSLLPILLGDTQSRISMLTAVTASMSLQLLALSGMVALGVIAALKYVFSDIVLADNPTMGPVAAAKESKRLTQGRKGQVFRLYIGFILWYLLLMLAIEMSLTMFGSVVSLMVEMLGSLAINVYLSSSVCALWLGCRGQWKNPLDPEDPEREEEDGDEEEENEESGIQTCQRSLC